MTTVTHFPFDPREDGSWHQLGSASSSSRVGLIARLDAITNHLTTVASAPDLYSHAFNKEIMCLLCL
eukprot:1265209-Amphidinium_carterae.1